MYQDNPFEEGDVLAMHIKTKNPTSVAVTDPLGDVTLYPGWGAAIAAFEDGTLTNEQWRCHHIKEDQWMRTRFSDAHWPFAIVQNTSCCPWRDKSHKWKRFNAKWIGPKNVTGSRQYFCRYTVPKDQTVIDGSAITATISAPSINVTAMSVAMSSAQVAVSISAPAKVSCSILDAKYELRAPSPLEVEKNGRYIDVTGWLDVTSGNYRHPYSHDALDWLTVASEIECQKKCEEYHAGKPGGPCGAITYYRVGSDATTNANCKLMRGLDNASLMLTYEFANERVMHMSLQTFPVKDTIGVPGLLFPGSVYTAYCTTRDMTRPMTLPWSGVKDTKITTRIPGCFDCGLKTLPAVTIEGGFASNTAITAVVYSTQAGRVFCGAKVLPTYTASFSQTAEEIKAESIAKSRHFSLVAKAETSAQVTVTNLAPNTLYEIGCMAESDDGGESEQANLVESRRKWQTQLLEIPLWSMAILFTVTAGDPPTASLSVRVRMTVVGYLFCQSYFTEDTKETVVPNAGRLKREGYRIKVADIKQEAGGVFPNIVHNKTYQVFCTGELNDFKNESDYDEDGRPPDYPEATVVRYAAQLDEVHLEIDIRRGPATTYCRAFRWPTRPYSERPGEPEVSMMRASPFHQTTMVTSTGVFILPMSGLASGSLHDLYCYSEEYLPPAPEGAVEPARRGMTLLAISQTRITLKTEGPKYRDAGWSCKAGHQCGVSDIEGAGLSSLDKVIVQGDQCPGSCQCNSKEDEDRKGATCSAVSHDRSVRAPDPMFSGAEAIDKADPNGPWCYVNQAACFDEVSSVTFPHLYISYAACIFQNSTVGAAGTGPPGFPDRGIARMSSSLGDAYDFGSEPLHAGGKPYQLCWCNGTQSECKAVSDYRLRIGILHLAGPSAEQQLSTMSCIAGQPCTLTQFKGHGLANGNRLVVMPNTDRGCHWYRETPGDAISTPGIPNFAVSLPATEGGTSYSWGAETVQAGGGIYLLCWCGTVYGAHHTERPDCPVPRPEKGDHYLAAAGKLSIVGPEIGGLRICRVGQDCQLNDIPGNGLEGGDKLSIQKSCGSSTPAPIDWATGTPGAGGASALLPLWEQGGWLTYGPVMADGILESSGGPLRSDSLTSRGVWGMPNYGMSKPDARVGFFSWGAPSQLAPGTYSLCWCAARAECTDPEHFKVLISPIRFIGPAVLPSASQARVCVRNRQCELLNYTGVWPSSGGQFLIARGLCGSSSFALGAPRKGISYTTANGNDFVWGQDPIITPPGKYRLCWCFQAFACTQDSDFASYGGMLRVKAPYGPLRYFFCAMNAPCYIRDVFGEASHSGDKVMIMTVCGDGLGTDGFVDRGVSVDTGLDGTWFQLPLAIKAGSYRACWCAGETLCAGGNDFDHDLGQMVVGGPDSSAVYQCYEWEPCTLPGLIGTELRRGDRLLAISPLLNCSEPNITTIGLSGWPEGGLSGFAVERGTIFSWGSKQVRVAPGVYQLCWCSSMAAPAGICNESASFDMPAGFMKVGTSKEFQFATRVEDPEERQMDAMYGLLLLAPLALGACTLFVLGFKRITTMNTKLERVAPDPFPQKKAWSAAEQDKLKLTHAVKQVASQRELSRGTKALFDQEEMEIELPDFTGTRKKSIGSMFKTMHQNAIADISKAIEDIGDAKKKAIANLGEEDNAAIAPTKSNKAKQKGSKLSKLFGGAGDPSDKSSEVRGLKLSIPDESAQEPEPDSPTSPTSPEAAPKSRAGGRSNAFMPKKKKKKKETLAGGGIGPASPTGNWADEWEEDDGPMPPDMDFSFNADARRRDMMLKILDM
jgi:hypothetical protein